MTGRALSLRLGIVLAAGAAIALATSLFIHAELDRPTGRSRSGPGTLRVKPGASLRAVTEDLAGQGWIGSPRLIAEWGKRRNLDRRIMPGRYRLERGWTPRRILEELAAGRVETVRVTIPEGWREQQVLELLADSLECDRGELRAAALDSAWVRGLGISDGRLEGYLFPETYLMPKEYDPREALARMVREGDRRFDPAMRRRALQRGLERREIVTLASIVQAEAALVQEMPRIAAVFLQRLGMGWRLEADPTVLYALGRFTGPPLKRDLEVQSPYNTYRVRGLPPGPICNPGSAAIRAVLWPDSGRTDLYFVAKGGGMHEFSRTLREHNEARRRMRRTRGER